MAPPSPARRGFTLIEMLVVVAIIATLAGLLIPAVGLARRKMNDVKCGNQLQQVGATMTIFADEHDDAFPVTLRSLVDPGGLLAGLGRILVCPCDPSRGTDSQLNRQRFGASANWDLSYLAEPNCSYLYETSGKFLANSAQADYFFGYQKQVDAANASTPGYVSKFPDYATTTWFKAKKNQMNVGNLTAAGDYGASFAGGVFPIIRCYWHETIWSDAKAKTHRHVQNVGWDLNVFWSLPRWELDVDARFGP